MSEQIKRKVAEGYLRAARQCLAEGNLEAAEFGIELARRHDPSLPPLRSRVVDVPEQRPWWKFWASVDG